MQEYLTPLARSQSVFWEEAIEAIQGLINFHNPGYAGASQDLSVLYEFIKRDQHDKYKVVLPYLAQWALESPTLFRTRQASMQSGQSSCVVLNRVQVRSLLSLLFWCAIPPAHSSARSVSFLRIYGTSKPGRFEALIAKLHCFFSYFMQVNYITSNEEVHFRRVSLPITIRNDQVPMREVKVVEDSGTQIEMFADVVQVDFADKSFGGGVLANGCAQEECMLLAYVEPIVGLLYLPDPLLNSEVIYISGIRLFSQYSGYGDTFTFQGSISPPSDSRVLLAIDADDYRKRESSQYQTRSIVSELNKVLLGFAAAPVPPAFEIVTGNWGCGVFKGDFQLKFLIQWVAASLCNRKLRYLSWSKSELAGLKNWVLFFGQFSVNQVKDALMHLQPPGLEVFQQVKEHIARKWNLRF